MWRYPACEKLIKMSGWVLEDDHLRLRDNSHVHIVSNLLKSRCKLSITAASSSALGKREQNDDVQ